MIHQLPLPLTADETLVTDSNPLLQPKDVTIGLTSPTYYGKFVARLA